MPARQYHAIPDPQPFRILEDQEEQTGVILLGWGDGFTAAQLEQIRSSPGNGSPLPQQIRSLDQLDCPPGFSEADKLACYVVYLWNVDRGAWFWKTRQSAFGPEIPESMQYPYLTTEEWERGRPAAFLHGWLEGRVTFWDQARIHLASVARTDAFLFNQQLQAQEGDLQAVGFGKTLATQAYQMWTSVPGDS